MSREELIEQIKKDKEVRETVCLKEIQEVLAKHECVLVVPGFDLVDGKMIPKVAVQSKC